jgi:large subunit ribosomal protein L23
MHSYDVLRRPVVTEKTDVMSERLNQYVFEVARAANKRQIETAVEKAFKVSVLSVRTMVMPGKPRRWGRHVSRTPRWKKAIVTLAKGDRIDLFE